MRDVRRRDLREERAELLVIGVDIIGLLVGRTENWSCELVGSVVLSIGYAGEYVLCMVLDLYPG